MAMVKHVSLVLTVTIAALLSSCQDRHASDSFNAADHVDPAEDELTMNEEEADTSSATQKGREPSDAPSGPFAAIQMLPPLLRASDFNSATAIHAANYFIDCGESVAREALITYGKLCRELSWPHKEYLDLNEDRLIIMALILYRNVGEDPIPVPRQWVIASQWAHNGDIAYAGWPQFPLTLEGDTPFLLADGWRLSGVSEDALAWFQRIVEVYQYRTQPLRINDARAALESVGERLGKKWPTTIESNKRDMQRLLEKLGRQLQTAQPENE